MTFSVSRRFRPVRAPLSAALAAVFSFNAFAQDKPLEPVVVTASRVPQLATEVLNDNLVISSEEIARSGGTSLVDVLQRQRGLEIVRNGGPGTQSSVLIRGADNRQAVVLVDGVRIGSATSGGASWNAIPLSQIDRVEVVYGPLSTMYGADAVGGVIQIFTRQGEGPPALTAAAGLGSWDTRNVEAGISGGTGGWRYALRAAHEESDSFSALKPGSLSYNPDRDGYDSKSASGRLSYELSAGHELGATFLHSRLASRFDNARTYDDRSDSKAAAYGIFLKNRILPNWHSTVQFGRSYDTSDSDAAFGRTSYDTVQDTLSWQNNFTVFGTDVLQVIAERREEEVESSEAALSRDRSNNAIAIAYQLRRGAHLAAASVRNDDNSQFGSHTTGSLSYGYKINRAWRASASVGTSFRAPTFNELYFPGYGVPTNQPEKGRNTEAGVHYDDGSYRLNATYFRNRLSDLLVSTRTCPVTPASFPFGCAYNVNRAVLEGVSLGAGAALGNFRLSGTLDFLDPRDETTGNRLARRARKHGTLGLDYGAGPLTTGAEVIFSGDRYDDAANRNQLGGYGLLNLHATYALSKEWSLFGRWNNVFDKDYELARNYNTAGSSFFVGVRYGAR